jgi:hypothetical protein
VAGTILFGVRRLALLAVAACAQPAARPVPPPHPRLAGDVLRDAAQRGPVTLALEIGTDSGDLVVEAGDLRAHGADVRIVTFDGDDMADTLAKESSSGRLMLVLAGDQHRHFVVNLLGMRGATFRMLRIGPRAAPPP